MNLTGVCIKYIRRNEKTGDSTLLLRTSEKDIFCQGITQNYPPLTPLKLSGNFHTESTFAIETIQFDSSQKEALKNFLNSDFFSGIGEVGAEKLSLAMSSNQELITTKETEEPLKNYSEAARKAIRKISNFIAFEELYQYLSQFGCRYYSAWQAFGQYREGTLTHVKQFPYSLLLYDASFSVCEKIAKENQVECSQRERIQSIVMDAFIKNHKNGNTRISFANLCDRIRRLEKAANCGYVTNPLFVAEELIRNEYHIEYTEDAVYLYLAEDQQAEVQIASNVKRLLQSVTAYPNPKLSISDLEEKFSIRYSKEQKESFRVIDTSGIKIITGGPGTGKTTVLNGILTKFIANHPEKNVTLCAPTGCAAKRMRETTGMPATTIHKLLQIKPYEKNEFYRSQKISADCIIIDECSMIDTYLMAQVLSSVKSDAIVILLGDKDQLPSVEAGNVLRDLIQSNLIETHQLQTIFRQANENVIIGNSKNVMLGISNLKENQQFQIKRLSSEEEIRKEAVEIARKCFEHGIPNVKLYSPVKKVKFPCSTINMNRLIQSERNRIKGCDTSKHAPLEYGCYRFYVGDDVIFTRNNYEKGYYNGQEGVITCIQKHNDAVYMTIATEEGNITVSGNEFNEVELNYAITAHKSQGGECDTAVIVVPKKPKSMLQRKILYVEMTRAKKNVLILSEEDALEQTISNFMEIQRTTGLLEKLKLLFN